MASSHCSHFRYGSCKICSGRYRFLTSSFLDLSSSLLIKSKSLITLFFLLTKKGYYLASARELIRINGTTKAPVMNYAAETSLGVVTIRAFNMVDRFFQNYLKLIDTDAKLFFYSNAAMEWLVLRIEALQNLTLVTAAFLLVLLPKGYVAPGIYTYIYIYIYIYIWSCLQQSPFFCAS